MNRGLVLLSAALAVVFLVALAGILSFSSQERERDLGHLRSSLSIVASSRARDVEDWLLRQQEVLNDLANNESLQLYVNVVRSMRDEDGSTAAELGYLRNLLEATARRTGFAANPGQEQLPANVRPIGVAGLALLEPDGSLMVASVGMPPIEGSLADFVAATPPAERGFYDLRLDARGQLVLGWLVPIFSDEAGTGQAGVAARLLGIRPVDADFFAALKQPGATSASAESYLVRRSGDLLENVTPLADGSRPLSRRLSIDNDNALVVAAFQQPGGFQRGLNYASDPAFAVSEQIAGTPWVLLHQIDQDEALQQSDRRRLLLTSILLAITIGVAAAILLIWRFATSARVEQSARAYRESSERFQALTLFLDAVSDSLPNPVFATDSAQTVTFANKRFAELNDIPKAEITGRKLIGLLGQDRGRVYEEIAERVHSTGHESTLVQTFSDGDEEVVWRSYHCVLPSSGDAQADVLTTIEDLTDLTRERRRREQNTRQLIDTLVGLVDERDPDSAHQSRFVSQVSRQLATELGLEPLLIDTAEQAGRLVNIGKIRVPEEILTKQGALTDAERALVHSALDSGPRLLRHLTFEGPVIETLEQINERFDGKGRPQGLSGDDILATAQTVAVANTFVAMISPRAFREGHAFDEAENELLREADHKFDKKVLLSLLNFLNNKGGRQAWAFMTASREQGATD